MSTVFDDAAGDCMNNARILVIDDEPQIRRVMRTGLTAQDYFIDDARSGDEALEKLRQARFDLILLDMIMPGMSGLEPCQEFAQLPTRRLSC